jgi:hypothetical protein
MMLPTKVILTNEYNNQLFTCTNRAWGCRWLVVLSSLMLIYAQYFSNVFSSGWQHDLDFQHDAASIKYRASIVPPSTTWAHAANATTVRARKNLPFNGMGMEAGKNAMPPNTPGAYIHIGKCGGSTMSSQLANGCHSWVAKPCKTVQNETIISKSTTYYHTPDFPRSTIKEQHYSFYVVQIRDPFARFRAIFANYHMDNFPNRKRRQVGKDDWERQVQFSQCFPSLEDFAQAAQIEGEQSTWEASHLDAPTKLKCSRMPREIFTYQVVYSEHWFWNHETVYRKALLVNPYFSNATVLAVRTENIWGDWISANQDLGQEEVYVPPNPPHLRNYGQMKLPVSTILSETGQKNMCHGLTNDYKAYIGLLRLAYNIDDTQKLESLRISQANCPWLQLSMDFI